MTRVVRNPWPSFIGLGIRAATSAALGALLGSMAWGCSLLVDTTGLSSEADDLRRADSGTSFIRRRTRRSRRSASDVAVTPRTEAFIEAARQRRRDLDRPRAPCVDVARAERAGEV